MKNKLKSGTFRKTLKAKTRKIRKTKKIKGGKYEKKICGISEEDNTCLTRFLNEDGFTIQYINPDGNCFFESIATFFRNNNIANPSDVNLHQKLRTDIYNYLKSDEGIKLYEQAVNTERQSYKNQVNTVKDVGSWSRNINDIVINAMADKYGLEFIIYNFIKNDPSKVTIYTITPNEELKKPIRATIPLLRINDNHFNLLIPNLENSYYKAFKNSGNTNMSLNLGAAVKNHIKDLENKRNKNLENSYYKDVKNNGNMNMSFNLGAAVKNMD